MALPPEPRCPHCGRSFETWPLARIHTKRCRKSPHPRRRRRVRPRTVREIFDV
jgi:hypothetical protein